MILFFSSFAYSAAENIRRMDISEVNDILEKIALPGGHKKAILQLIDTKINNDMKEVIEEIRRLEKEIKIVYWVIGIAMAVILFVVARK